MDTDRARSAVFFAAYFLLRPDLRGAMHTSRTLPGDAVCVKLGQGNQLWDRHTGLSHGDRQEKT